MKQILDLMTALFIENKKKRRSWNKEKKIVNETSLVYQKENVF
jgi:hypothetical protein